MKYVIVVEGALSPVYAIGLFDSEDEASKFASKTLSFPRIWRIAKLKSPAQETSE